ncbi:hypothetical protein PMAYCL1PPCAC_24426, partial [Pristionchus mayeri]
LWETSLQATALTGSTVLERACATLGRATVVDLGPMPQKSSRLPAPAKRASPAPSNAFILSSYTVYPPLSNHRRL